ncbi:hypothetical protein [Arthrobacter sp. zg-Y1110]|uniref:hypothetical protein n=1 Tax=Arthrobacter sp. zg-Y1110 TaxID=2886932 RepID=UPI001D140D61|nr:hypothetical protein [Arthrobacter sp. zg-Y1110]MCC3292365.1 hypothetical protein [Arthrobacter sp. zg-Y1110]UWX86732.1 hypothetical protein N2K99_17980 [Arthrobacter sp. zg-Y1110]
MNKVSHTGRKAVTAAVLLISVALTREAGGGRRLASALGSARPGDMTARNLRHRSAALQRHLKHNPRDVLAAGLLNDVETEIIRRS